MYIYGLLIILLAYLVYRKYYVGETSIVSIIPGYGEIEDVGFVEPEITDGYDPYDNTMAKTNETNLEFDESNTLSHVNDIVELSPDKYHIIEAFNNSGKTVVISDSKKRLLNLNDESMKCYQVGKQWVQCIYRLI